MYMCLYSYKLFKEDKKQEYFWGKGSSRLELRGYDLLNCLCAFKFLFYVSIALLIKTFNDSLIYIFFKSLNY